MLGISSGAVDSLRLGCCKIEVLRAYMLSHMLHNVGKDTWENVWKYAEMESKKKKKGNKMLMATSLFTVSLCAILSCMLQIAQHWFQSVYAVQLDHFYPLCFFFTASQWFPILKITFGKFSICPLLKTLRQVLLNYSITCLFLFYITSFHFIMSMLVVF